MCYVARNPKVVLIDICGMFTNRNGRHTSQSQCYSAETDGAVSSDEVCGFVGGPEMPVLNLPMQKVSLRTKSYK